MRISKFGLTNQMSEKNRKIFSSIFRGSFFWKWNLEKIVVLHYSVFRNILPTSVIFKIVIKKKNSDLSFSHPPGSIKKWKSKISTSVPDFFFGGQKKQRKNTKIIKKKKNRIFLQNFLNFQNFDLKLRQTVYLADTKLFLNTKIQSFGF